MHAKSSARRSACTKPAAPPSSPSADRDQRSGVVHGSPPGQRRDPSGIGRSSNGRTTDSDSVYLGSNPSLPANKIKGLAEMLGPSFLCVLPMCYHAVGNHPLSLGSSGTMLSLLTVP